MTKYEEIQEVAATARKNAIAQRERCWRYLNFLVVGLLKYCGIPQGQITYLRSNEATGDQRVYREAEEGSRYTLLGATVLDKEDGYYHLGVCITLTPSNKFPKDWISFALCVAEKDGKPMAKIGFLGEPRQIDLNDQKQCEAFYDSVVESIKQCYRDPRRTSSKVIGFTVSSSDDNPTAEVTSKSGP